jgi:hypothetical protein
VCELHPDELIYGSPRDEPVALLACFWCLAFAALRAEARMSDFRNLVASQHDPL